MKIRISIQFCLLIAAVSMIAGCSSDGALAPVSGTVTIDGKPAPGVEVVYSPLPVEGNSNVGPYSFALTDDVGHYELKTRYGKTGAVVGKHVVTFAYPDVDPEEMEELADELDEAESKQEAAEVKAEMARIQGVLKGRPKIPASASGEGIEVEVSSSGHEDADFELNDK